MNVVMVQGSGDMKFSEIPQFMAEGNYEVNTSLDFLQDRIDCWVQEDGILLDPDFQRGHVWTEKQQIKWLEYFLQGGKSGRILYFNAPWWGDFAKDKYEYTDFVLVDGLQRLTAFLKFLNNELPIFGGFLRCQFKDRLILAKSNSNLKININNLKTKKDVLTWYIQMNEGGTPHTEDELDKVKILLDQENG